MEVTKTYLGFSTADAEAIDIRFRDGDLLLTFRDWQEQPQSITFAECVAFRWRAADEVELRDDAVYEMKRSPWLAEQAAQHSVPAEEYQHLKLCFNGHGVLDVIARRH